MSRGRWIKALGAGLLAGVVAAFVMTVVMILLRLYLGVPLPAELGGDRFLPNLSVNQFLVTLFRAGGPLAAKRTALLSGFAGVLAVGALAGPVYAVIVEWLRGKNPDRERRFGVSPGGVLFVVVAVVVLWAVSMAVLRPVLGASDIGLTLGLASVATAAGFLVSYASYGVALILVYRALTSRRPIRRTVPVGQPLGRRAFLASGVGVILALGSGGLIRRGYDTSTLSYDGMGYTGAKVKPITPNDQFYSVTKNIIDPKVRKAVWRLQVDGAVDKPRTYNFDDIASMPSVEQEMTLECISNPVGGGLMSNAVWKGVPLKQLIEAAGPKRGAVEILLHAADGYTHDVSFEKAMEDTTLLAYEMNGEPLPDRNGYPARVLVPGYYGEGSAKWVTRIEVFEHHVQDHYYGKQGWKPRDVHTVSRFDPARFAPAPPKKAEKVPFKRGKTTTLKGVAFAGDRGVSKVEVSTDGGSSWQEAKIDYEGTKLTWVFWSYDWSPNRTGDRQLVVRATDGNGVPQMKGNPGGPADGQSGYDKLAAGVKA